MTLLGMISAGVLVAVLTFAASAKLRSRQATTEDFGSLGLPRPELWAVAVPIMELAAAALLVLNPGWGGVVAFAMLAAFTVNLVAVIRSGRVATCACFGGTSAEPVSSKHLVRNGALLFLAAVAATTQGWIWTIVA